MEFIALSGGLKTIILIMNLMEEIQEQGVSMMSIKRLKLNARYSEITQGL